MNDVPSRPVELVAELVRFGVVGLVATVTYLIVSIVVRSAGAGNYFANFSGYIASVAISYFGHRIVTFRSKQAHRRQGPRFILVSLLAFGLTNLIVYIFVDRLNLAFAFAAVAVAVSIPLFTWLLARTWVFRPGKRGPALDPSSDTP